MNPVITKSSISNPRRRLVELLQYLNFGKIIGLHIDDGEPNFDRPFRLIKSFKTSGETSRPESALQDFQLKQQVVAMLQAITELGNGVVSIDVRNGLPAMLEIEEAKNAGGPTRA